mmetsp:Transcript_43670/g.91885  ORF Transcript_43670/g.91885 Transcript_43670/m.91885 type:complete len:460 (-) Transcript_43670:89-1468(-)|eukprot:CAMPEP_0183704262 /NCGR_PEP_ID=MMETSP0737-20130205/1647_1 /TAXON_ID=385413 /ORGANISM="Thalassiosira miniscula, Strain CCMP1093" /LENGTH=459 /DNA_ID=CAMNT_0025931095 /DNA_START=257 /DNA_END=1636 /DNA_ORIENTATION=+
MNLLKALLFLQTCAVTSSASLRGSNIKERELITRIIDGESVPEGQYSYAVSLRDDLGHFCGGSLIAPDVVLSAAHCAVKDDFKVVIGRHHLESTVGDEVDVNVKMLHPDYNSTTTNNDFMLLFLERATTEDVDLVELSPDPVFAGAAVTAMGWGDTHIDKDIQELATELMEVQLKVITNDECDRSDSDQEGWDYDYNGKITSSMMCAEHDEQKDACQGDSGGPLVIHSESGGDIQVGVVSWGIGCAHDDFPGVYARVSAQHDWIRKSVCEGSSAAPDYFQCDDIISQAANTQDQSDVETQNLSNQGGWRTIIEEEFTRGLGLFNQRGNDARRYSSAMNRAGVVRMAGGEGGSSMQSNEIHPRNNLFSEFSRFKVSFSFYAIEMEHSDDLCLDYELDNGKITGEKCWSSLNAFDNGRWYDDMSLEFAASHAERLRIRFRVNGDDAEDDVLFDSVRIQGHA